MHIINEICKKIWKDQPSSCKASFSSSFISLVSLIVILVMSLILFIISLIHFRKWSVIWPPKPIGIFNPSVAILFPKTLFILLSVTVCCNCTFSLQISFSMQYRLGLLADRKQTPLQGYKITVPSNSFSYCISLFYFRIHIHFHYWKRHQNHYVLEEFLLILLIQLFFLFSFDVLVFVALFWTYFFLFLTLNLIMVFPQLFYYVFGGRFCL